MTTVYRFYIIKCNNQVVGIFKQEKNAINFMNKLKSVDNKLGLKLETVELINTDHIVSTDCGKEG